ncbi:hypothetical protein V8F33_003032 [Rhypophila sp. PSN 637]
MAVELAFLCRFGFLFVLSGPVLGKWWVGVNGNSWTPLFSCLLESGCTGPQPNTHPRFRIYVGACNRSILDPCATFRLLLLSYMLFSICRLAGCM